MDMLEKDAAKAVRQTRAEQLNTALYKKMFAAQEHYRAWLLSQTPEEILNHTYEYTMREDILTELDANPLPAKQAKALMALKDPLAEIFKDYNKKDARYMEDILETIVQRADSEIRRREQQSSLER